MPKSKGIKTETIKREVNLVNTIQSVSLQTNGSATSSGATTPSVSGGGAIDWKKKYKEEFDKRFAIEEQYDDLQTQVFLYMENEGSWDHLGYPVGDGSKFWVLHIE